MTCALRRAGACGDLCGGACGLDRRADEDAGADAELLTERLIGLITAGEVSELRFEGLRLTGLPLHGRTVSGPIVFMGCAVAGMADLSELTLLGDTAFIGCEFEGPFKAQDMRATSRLRFGRCTFKRGAVFDGMQAERGAEFKESVFLGDAYFRRVGFEYDASFSGCVFKSRANFRNATFVGYADFTDAFMRGRTKFLGAKFSDELRLKGARIAVLRSLGAHGINFDGAIIEEGHFHEVHELRDCTFRNAVLMAVSFRGRQLVNCDFTGATFKAVLVDGSEFDGATLEKTKYIYTDYIVDSDDGARRRYIPAEDSRVPAEGEFSTGGNDPFDLATYFSEVSAWTISLRVPPELRNALLNYVSFFSEFLRAGTGHDCEVRTRREGARLRVEVSGFPVDRNAAIDEYFWKYLDFARRSNKESLNITFSASLPEWERELFMIRFEHRINELNTEVKYLRRLLEKEEDKNLQFQRFATVLALEPKLALEAVHPARPSSYETSIFILTADMQGYTAATQGRPDLSARLQRFLFDQQEKIGADPACELVKMEGDCLKVFFRDGLRLIWVSRQLLADFEAWKYQNPCDIRGLRAILGYGICTRESRGEKVDFTGDIIVTMVRLDQPMKKYIAANNEDSNQIWCTNSFRAQVDDRHPNVVFTPLPRLDLDKGFESDETFYRVRVT